MLVARGSTVLGWAVDRPERGQEIRTWADAGSAFFKFPSPQVIGAQLVIALLLRLHVGGFSAWDVVIPLAVAIYWPFQEWFLHVAFLHWRPRRIGRWHVDPMMAQAHRAHHAEPWRLDLVFLPLRFVLPLLPIHAVFWAWVTPTTGAALTGIFCFSAATLLYEWVHYLSHTSVRAKGGTYRQIRRGHRLHHFKNEHYWYAFTVPGVDRILSTNPDPRDVPVSPTARTLYPDGPLDA